MRVLYHKFCRIARGKMQKFKFLGEDVRFPSSSWESSCRAGITNVTVLTQEWASFVSPRPFRVFISGDTLVVLGGLSSKGASLCRTTLTNVIFCTLERASFVSPRPFRAPAASQARRREFFSLTLENRGHPLRGFPRVATAHRADCSSPSCVSLTLLKEHA